MGLKKDKIRHFWEEANYGRGGEFEILWWRDSGVSPKINFMFIAYILTQTFIEEILTFQDTSPSPRNTSTQFGI